MSMRVTAAGIVLLALTACSNQPMAPANGPNIGGEFQLVSVDGHALPCCAQTDSTGRTASILGGTLALKDAAPERFVATPAGWYPSSCVHEAGGVDPAYYVCGDATYRLILARLYEPLSVTVDTTVGLYAWSVSQPAMIKLMGNAMGGPVALSDTATVLTVQALNVMGPYGPTYEFSRVGP
jgi:hypothetical protein